MAFSTSQFQTISNAVDARTGRELWRYDWEDHGGHLVGNRGVGMRGDWLYFLAPDDWLICLNAATGRERWRKKVADEKQQYFTTMAPLVVGNHISRRNLRVSHRDLTSTDDALALDDMKIVVHGEACESVHLFTGGRPLNLDFINPRGVSGSQHLTGIVRG